MNRNFGHVNCFLILYLFIQNLLPSSISLQFKSINGDMLMNHAFLQRIRNVLLPVGWQRFQVQPNKLSIIWPVELKKLVFKSMDRIWGRNFVSGFCSSLYKVFYELILWLRKTPYFIWLCMQYVTCVKISCGIWLCTFPCYVCL